MNLLKLSFLLYILKWSAGKGFWYQLYGWEETMFSVGVFEESILLIGLSNAMTVIFFLAGIIFLFFL